MASKRRCTSSCCRRSLIFRSARTAPSTASGVNSSSSCIKIDASSRRSSSLRAKSSGSPPNSSAPMSAAISDSAASPSCSNSDCSAKRAWRAGSNSSSAPSRAELRESPACISRAAASARISTRSAPVICVSVGAFTAAADREVARCFSSCRSTPESIPSFCEISIANSSREIRLGTR